MIAKGGLRDRMAVGSPGAVEPARDMLLRLTLAVGTAYLVFLLASYAAVGATPGIEILPFVIGLVALFLGRRRRRPSNGSRSSSSSSPGKLSEESARRSDRRSRPTPSSIWNAPS